MQPVHSLEYELTSELATEIQRALLRWELKRSWRRELPVFCGAAVLAALIIWLGLTGWILPGVGGGLLGLLMLFVMVSLLRRLYGARATVASALLALQVSDRRVRIEFGEERLRLENEFFRGEGAWTELDDVVIFPSFWVLYLTNSGQVVIPGARMTPELEAFLRSKAEHVRVPIRQG
jgi:hypothetical protein